MKRKRNRLPNKRTKLDEEIPSDSDEAISSAESTDGDESSELETAHEKHIRLTKKAIQRAKEQIGSDEDELEAFSLRLKEEALLDKGRIILPVAHKLLPFETSNVIILNGHKRAVTCLCVSEDGKVVYSGGKDSSVIKWSLETFRKLMVIRGGKRGSSYAYHTGPILSIALSSDEKYLASSGMDETVIVWNPASMTVLMKLRRHRAAVTAVAFRRQSHMLFTADTSGRLCVWNMPLTEVLQDQGARTNIEILGLCGLTAERCVSCSGFGGPGISVWKVPEEVCVQYGTKNPVETAIDCVYAVSDELFIGGSATNKLYVWHTSRGSPVFTVPKAHPEPKLVEPSMEEEDGQSQFRRPVANWVTAITGLPGTDLIATGASTGYVQFWRVVRAQDQHIQSAIDAARQPNQRTDIKLERLSGRALFLDGFVNDLKFTPDRQFLLVALGQEHRLGKWEPRRPVNPTLSLIPLNLPNR